MSNSNNAKAIYSEGFSCAPAVAATYCEQLGLERDQALKIATGFGGGMHLGQTCGAVTGAIMVVGLKYGKSKADDNKARDKKLFTTICVEYVAAAAEILDEIL